MTTVEKLKLRNEPIDLFLVDQQMPAMNGVEFLEQAPPIFPKFPLVAAMASSEELSGE